MSWREELAWAAGFYDGEGNACRTKSGTQLTIGQRDLEPLERFQRAMLGLGKIYGPYARPNGGTTMYYWKATRHEVRQAVIAMLWSFLSHPKRRQLNETFNGVQV